ncbi:MAG: ATP-binding protein [Muribaculaceae bacterium]|nr:ATP-binding protein [Muribaculaceae bacterium]
MQRLIHTYNRLLANVDETFIRYLYPLIDWNNRLIVIKGARGVGKTTMLLQHIKKAFPDVKKALYASLDNIWFTTNTLIDLAEYHYTHGGTHLFLDEIHRYQGWQREIKNIYDSYPDLHVVITGSSLLKLEESIIADLSRRHRQYTLNGMSFREYLQLEDVASLPPLSLQDILDKHVEIAVQITSKTKVLQHFEEYVHHGFYPFYREDEEGFEDRLQQIIDTIIESEIPAVSDIKYDSVYKAKRLLGILAQQSPYTLNIAALSNTLQVSRENVLKLLDLMDKSALVRKLYSHSGGMKMLVKPEKILFDNSNIMFALSNHADAGTMRETLFASQLNVGHQLYMPQQGDFVVDDAFTFEVGGRGKGYKQIRNLENSYVVQDEIELGIDNKIPLWLFGCLY